MKDLFFIFALLIALGIAWAFTGGYTNESAKDPFIFPLAPLGTGETYDDLSLRRNPFAFNYTFVTHQSSRSDDEEDEEEFDIPELSTVGEVSPYKNEVYFDKSLNGPKESLASEEYVRIRANKRNDAPINISGWKLSSPISKQTFSLVRGAQIPESGVINVEEDIYLSPGHIAIITTGRSPVGVSFRENICTGYFEQFKDFNPELELDCPYADEELGYVSPLDPNFNSDCEDFLEDVPRCQMPLSGLPLSVTNACRSFIAETINYTGCIERHRDDDTFLLDTWRLFLGKSNEIWKERREIILLLDEENKIVDTLSY